MMLYHVSVRASATQYQPREFRPNDRIVPSDSRWQPSLLRWSRMESQCRWGVCGQLQRFASLVPSILTEYIQDCPTWSLCLADFISVQVFESQL
jgi:hypothetical protein